MHQPPNPKQVTIFRDRVGANVLPSRVVSAADARLKRVEDNVTKCCAVECEMENSRILQSENTSNVRIWGGWVSPRESEVGVGVGGDTQQGRC